MRPFACLLCLTLTAAAHAAAPDASQVPTLPNEVIFACLSPNLTEQASGLSWQALTPEAWGKAITVQEGEERHTFSQDGAAHPNDWVRTRITLSQAPQTAANPAPIQTLTVTAIPSGIIPETTVTFNLLKEAALPPCTAKVWGGRPALVANAGNWFIIAESAKAKLVRVEGEKPRWTLTETKTAKGIDEISASFRVGAGSLPPEPAAPAGK